MDKGAMDTLLLQGQKMLRKTDHGRSQAAGPGQIRLAALGQDAEMAFILPEFVCKGIK